MDREFFEKIADDLEGYKVFDDEFEFEDFSDADELDFDYYGRIDLYEEPVFSEGEDTMFNIRVFVEERTGKNRYMADFRVKEPLITDNYRNAWMDVSDKSLDDDHAYDKREATTIKAKMNIVHLAEKFFEQC